MDNLDKHFLQTRSDHSSAGQGRNPELRQPGRVSNAHSVFSMNYDAADMTLVKKCSAMTQYGPNSNALESKRLLLGQPQLISMSTAATYDAQGIFKENLRTASGEMRETDTGKVDINNENSNIAANQVRPPVKAAITTIPTPGGPAPQPEWQKMFASNAPTHVNFNHGKGDQYRLEVVTKQCPDQEAAPATDNAPMAARSQFNQNDDNSCDLLGGRKQNQEDVVMEGQEEACNQNGASGLKEKQVAGSNRRKLRPALREVPEAQHSEGFNRATSGLEKHAGVAQVGPSGLESNPVRNQDTPKMKQSTKSNKGRNQGTASNGKHNRRNVIIEDRTSLQGSSKSGRKLTALGGPLGNAAGRGIGSKSNKKKALLSQNGDQNVPINGQRSETKYYPDNIRFPANRQSLFGLQMNQVLRPASRAKDNTTKGLLLIKNKHLLTQQADSKPILKPHQVSLEGRNAESNRKEVGNESGRAYKSHRRFSEKLLKSSSNQIIHSGKQTPQKHLSDKRQGQDKSFNQLTEIGPKQAAPSCQEEASLVPACPGSPGMQTDQVAGPPHLNEYLLNKSITRNQSAERQAAASAQASREASPAMRHQASEQSSAIEQGAKQMTNRQDEVMESHPTRHMSRAATTDIQRQGLNLRSELGSDIQQYLRAKELEFDTTNCLERHEITAPIRARMVDWIIEVLTNFYCDDQTFFIAVSLMDRYFKNCPNPLKVQSLHLLGVTSMFVASKFEDINPLRMKTVDEKISQKKLAIEDIKRQELEILQVVKYQIHAPTILDFLKHFLYEVLGVQILDSAETCQKQERALQFVQMKKELLAAQPEHLRQTKPKHAKCNRFDNLELNDANLDEEAKAENYLIEKMSIYLAKMAMHDLDLSHRKPSLLAIGSIYVALKICEQLKKKDLINSTVVHRLIKKSKMEEGEILDVSQKVLFLAQNFDKAFPQLDNLKNTHFKLITQLL